MQPFYEYHKTDNKIVGYKFTGLLQAFNELFGAKFDLYKSRASLGSFHLSYEGKTEFCNSRNVLFNKLEKVYELPIESNKCIKQGLHFIIKLKEDHIVEAPESTVEKTSEEVNAVAPVEEEVVSETVTEGDNEEIIEDTKEEVDWDLVGNLYDDSAKKESKEKLEEYAKGFGVDLDKRKTFEGMVEQFKEFLEQL